jgi:sugar lactone lactonase YvrE
LITVEVVVEAGNTLGEGPVWDPDQGVWWLDILESQLHLFDLAGNWQTRELDETPGSLALAGEGRLLLALRRGLFLYDIGSETSAPVAAIEEDLPDNRLNDGKTDAAGRFWVGSMADDGRGKRGALYRWDGGVTRVFGDVGIPNSLAWSPDGRTMYFADGAVGAIFTFPYDPDTGRIGERRVFAEVEPPRAPDGSTVDTDGCLWNAEWGGARLVRYTPDGRVDRVVELPVAKPTCPTFGGPNLDLLYVTTARAGHAEDPLSSERHAGAVFVVDAGVTGLPAVPAVV